MLPGKRYTGPILDRPSPSLLLAFAMDGALDSRVTFTRADSGTRFDYAGVMQTETTDAARFTHDPATYYPSSTSNSISRGKKTFAVSYQYTVGAIVQATYDASNWMRGTVIAASGSSVTIRVEKSSGSGTYAAWNLIQCLGLLIEESRTNLLTYSEEFDNAAWTKSDTSITANSVIAPDGTTTGDTITASATSTSHSVNRGSGTTAGSVVSSIFAKQGTHQYLQFSANSAASVYANFDLSSGAIGTSSGCAATIDPLPNGWYRLKVAYNAALTVNSAPVWFMVTSASSARGESWLAAGTETIYIWGAQLEAGSFPTSYIKTTSSTATRAADSASITGSNFSSWYNQVEGTFVSSSVSYSRAPRACSFSDGTGANSIGTGSAGVAIPRLYIAKSSVEQANIAILNSGENYTEASAYKLDNIGYCVNGSEVSEDLSGEIPMVDRLSIGYFVVGGVYHNGTIASIAYYPKALPGYLQYLTS